MARLKQVNQVRRRRSAAAVQATTLREPRQLEGNYTSNRGGYAIYDGRVFLDTIRQPRPLVEAVRDAYSRRGHAHLSCTCAPTLATFQNDDYNAWSIKYFQDHSQPCPKHVDEAAVAHLRVATILVAAHQTRTCFERMYGQLLHLPHQDLLRIRVRNVRVGARAGFADPARTLTRGAAPTTLPGEVIEPHATMENSLVSRAALRAGPAGPHECAGQQGRSTG